MGADRQTPPHDDPNPQGVMMDASTLAPVETADPASRTKRLMAATAEAHHRLDAAVMACEPFASLPRYARFLEFQYRFHTVVDRLYGGSLYADRLPDLAARRRLALVRQDLLDLTGTARAEDTPQEPAAIGPEEGLGWLFVAEGSTLGAASLLKRAKQLGLSETHGARHLAGHPDGRGLYWRRFTTALDAIDLAPEGERRATDGANAAFRFVRRLAVDILAV